MMTSLCHVIFALIFAPALLVIEWISITKGRWQKTSLSSSKQQKLTNEDDKYRPCSSSSPYPYCDTSLSKEHRIDYLINILNITEKISLLGHESPEIIRQGVHLPAYKWWNEGLHGMAWTGCCPPYLWNNVTVFPQVIGLAMTFNRTLWAEVGDIIGTEATERREELIKKGPNNGNGDSMLPGLTYWFPNINIFRDPRWGRGQETPGECPYLTQHYAATIVMSAQYGIESIERMKKGSHLDHPSSIHPRIAATCKHFAAYSLETNRFNFSADIDDDRDLEDTYFPAFEACVHAGRFLSEYYGSEQHDVTAMGGALGVMCSYNSINKIPSCSNYELLTQKLRNDWAFKGYVTSDCGAIGGLYEDHEFASSYEEAVSLALLSGVDLNCGDTVKMYGISALEKDFMNVSNVDRALRNLFSVLMDVGYFNGNSKDKTPIEGSVKYTKQRRGDVAYEAALESITLLKNHGSPPVLPLSLKRHTKVVIFNGADEEILLGNYHGKPSFIITPKQGLENLGIEVKYKNITTDGRMGPNVCEDVMNANAAILFMGLNQTIESESLDRTSLLLPAFQHNAIDMVTHCNVVNNKAIPIVLVVMSGGTVDLTKYKAGSVDAILYTSYMGQAAGNALADILYGIKSPSGRLVTTMYPNSYLQQIQLDDMRMRPSNDTPGRTYRFYEGPVVYPFGFGLSYTSWNYSLSFISTASQVSVQIYNTGLVDSSNAILLFHMGPNAGERGEPIKSLIGFDKVFVHAGGTKKLNFDATKWISTQAQGIHTFMVGPSSEYHMKITIDEELPSIN